MHEAIAPKDAAHGRSGGVVGRPPIKPGTGKRGAGELVRAAYA